MPLAEAAVARFRAHLLTLTGPVDGRLVALAVSGGADSMAMLALAVAAWPGQVIAATVDHGLRADSAGEAAMVAGWCAGAGVPHATLTITEPRAAGDNLHDWARRERYRLLSHWGLAAGAHLLATAHHADDQAETFLMRAARGSGVAGLAGIRATQPLGESMIILVRPLLGWRRAELRAVALAAGLPFVDDPSNSDHRFDRARFRTLIEQTPLLDAAQLARAAGHAAEADATLRAIEDRLWAQRAVYDEADRAVRLDIADLPRELKRRLARRTIHSVRAAHGIAQPDFTDAENIEPLLDALDAGKAATHAGIKARSGGTAWHFSPAPPRRSR